MSLKSIRLPDNNIKRITVRDFLVVLLALSSLFAMLLIWPVGAMKDTAVSSSGPENNRSTGNITPEWNVFQNFVPQYDYIRSIGILVDRRGGESDAGNFLLEIYDAAGAQQRQVNFKMPEVGDRSQGYFDIPVNLEVIPGAFYTIRLYAFGTEEKPISVLYRTMSGAGPVENQAFAYVTGGDIIPDASLACRYIYGTPMGIRQILVYDLFFAALFFVARAFVLWLSDKKPGLLRKLTFSTGIRMVCTWGVCWIMVFSFYYLFIRKLFGGDAWDFGIYGAGLILGAAVFFFILWKGSLPETLKNPKACIPGMIQVICFGYYFSRYAPYFNSGSNYGHYINSSYMCIAAAVAMLSLFDGKLLLHWRNLLVSGLYWGGCAVHFLRQVHGLSADDRVLYLWAYTAGWLWVIVFVMTVVRLIRGERPRAAIPYTAVVAVFFVLTCVTRYKKWWPVTMTVLFGLLYCQKLDRVRMLELLRNFCKGALLSFWYTWAFSLLHRPYHYNNFSRYGMSFSSVAISGLYLVFVFVSALILLVEQYRKDHRLSRIWFHYLSMGALLSYIFMGLARTAILTVFVLAVVLLGAVWVLERGKVFRILAAMALSFLVLFPTVYTLTRCVPAIANDPVINPYEDFQDTIYKNERKDSPKYMTFSHFLELSSGRIITLFKGYLDRESVLDDTSRLTYEVSEDSYSGLTFTREQLQWLTRTRETRTNGEGNESAGEITNGRYAIFKLYLSRLNWKGHESMVITIGDTIYAHAHNTYLQLAYDHGIPCGIIFLLLLLMTLVRSVQFVRRNYAEDGAITLLPFLSLVAFLLAGMVEWVFQPVIPLAFGVLFVVYPLMAPIQRGK